MIPTKTRPSLKASANNSWKRLSILHIANCFCYYCYSDAISTSFWSTWQASQTQVPLLHGPFQVHDAYACNGLEAHYLILEQPGLVCKIQTYLICVCVWHFTPQYLVDTQECMYIHGREQNPKELMHGTMKQHINCLACTILNVLWVLATSDP